MFNGILQLPDAAAIVARLEDATPLIRPVACVKPGLRAYSAGEWDSRNAITVTETGHWFHTGDKLALAEDAPIGWTCRGCGVVATGSLLDPALGRCAHPATAQDVASALLGHLRPGPARMRAPRIRFITTQTTGASA